MEKRLVITRADEDVAEYTKITHPVIRKYAIRCNAKFEILKDCQGIHMHYRILQLYDKFEEYDRILIVDSDILIRKTCPNLFDAVPIEKIGLITEDRGSRQEDRRNRIAKANEFYGDIGWEEGYINTGVAIFSKEHRDIFKYIPDKDKLWMDYGYDDVFLGWRINKMKYELLVFHPYLNFMSMFTEPWAGLKKSNAQIIHYAGMGHHPNVPKPRQIENDYLVMKKYGAI